MEMKAGHKAERRAYCLVDKTEIGYEHSWKQLQPSSVKIIRSCYRSPPFVYNHYRILDPSCQRSVAGRNHFFYPVICIDAVVVILPVFGGMEDYRACPTPRDTQ